MPCWKSDVVYYTVVANDIRHGSNGFSGALILPSSQFLALQGFNSESWPKSQEQLSTALSEAASTMIQ